MASISSIRFCPRTVPANAPAGQKRLYMDSADGQLKTVDDEGNVVAVADGTGLPDAPSDGKQYARKDAAWVEAPDVSAVTVYYGLESETPASPIRGVEVGPFAGIPARVIAQIPEGQGIARIVSNARAIASVPSFAGYVLPYYENSIDLVFPDLETMCASAFQGLQLNAYSYQGFNFTSPKLRAVPASAFRESALYYATGFPLATSIGDSAFSGCSNLPTVSLPAATSIGDSAFDSCGNLSTISLPAATSIGAGAFYGCYSLNTVSLPLATSIGADAFANCICNDIYIDAPLSGVADTAFQYAQAISVNIHLRPSPHTPAGWTLGSGQALFGHANVNVAADWTSYPNLPA